MKAIVFGANGFVGYHLVNRLLAEEYQVLSIYNKSDSRIPAASDKMTVEEAGKINEHFDEVYIAVGSFSGTPEEFSNQVLEIVTILKRIKYTRAVFISSVAVYGNHTSILTEGSSFNSPGLYGSYKLAFEFLLSSMGNCSIIRFTYLYGPGMGKNSLLPKWVDAARSNKIISVFGDGSRVQDYLYIDDAIDLIRKVAVYPVMEPVIGASGQSVSNAELAAIIASLVPGTEIRFSGVDNSPSFRYDVSHLENKLNWKANTDIRKGLSLLIQE